MPYHNSPVNNTRSASKEVVFRLQEAQICEEVIVLRISNDY